MVAYRTHILRLGALATLLLGAAVSANAWINVSDGTNVGSSISQTSEYSTLFTGSFSWAQSSNAAMTIGTTTFTQGAESLEVAWTQTGSTTFGATESMVGDWTLVSESGLNVGPTGTYSASFDNIFQSGSAGNYNWAFVGTATPEPGAFGMLGLGVVGLFFRQRRNRR